MSGEYVADTGIETPNDTKNKRKSAKRVDVNILFSKVRAYQKKEKFENGIFLD